MKFTFTQIRLLRCMLVPVTVLLAASCMKDPMEESLTPGGPALRFAVTQSDGWSTVQSRAAGDAAEDAVSSDGPRFAGVFTLQGETPADTLFLHATVTDGIGTTDPDDEPDGQQKGVTRAAPLGPNSDFYDAFGVYAYTVPATAGNWQNATKTLYMKNIGVTKGSNWTTNYRWPGSGNKIRFFAYAPHGGQDITPVDNDATRSGTPSLVYTVPSEAADQKDLLVATSEMLAGDTETEAGLTFTHQLAAIKFAAANDLPNGSLTIKSISLEGINSRGTLAVNAAGSWGWVANSFGTPTEFTHTGINYAVKTNKQREQIIPDAQTFMMIPQSFGTDAAIVVTVEEPNVGEQTLRMSLANESAWLPGKTYTYTISSSSVTISEVFEVSIDNDGNFPYTGGGRAISVNSYIEVSSPKMNSGTALRRNVPWTVALNNTGDDTNWVTLGYTQAQLSGGSISFDATVAEQTPNAAQETPHENRLRARDPIGQPTGNATNSNIDHRIDLSTSYTYADGQGLAEQVGHKHLSQARETANCYIVNRPGYYRIPTVYGNAKIGDGNNTRAYLGNTVNNNPFVDHRGNRLLSPWIQLHLGGGTTPVDASRLKARLIWQSSEKLITNLFYSEQLGCCICFDIVKDDNLQINDIHQGNALIGLYYEPTSGVSELVWTWHIWITDYLDLQTYAPDTYNPDLPVSDIDITNKDGVPFTIMSVNLGWVNGPLTIYEKRSATATFTQEGGKTQTIPINQQRQSIEHRGHNPFYQWGRQVPLPGIQATEDGTGTQDMEWFDINGSSLGVMDRQNTGYNLPLATVMQNPTTFYYSYTGNGRWTSSLTPRYWNAEHEQSGMPTQNLNMSVQKSIYDPCPRGYRVSDADTYTGMTVSGNAYDLRESNAVFNFSMLNTPFRSVEDYNAISGWLFYANPDPKRTQNTVFPMRSTGNRASSSGLLAEQSFGKSANYWTNRMHTTTASSVQYPAAYSAVVDRRGVLPRSAAGNNVTFGLSVRCIRDRVTGRDPEKKVTVNGVTMDLNLVPLHQSYPGGGVN